MYKDILIEQLKNNKSFTIPMWLKRTRKDILDWLCQETKSFSDISIMERVYIVLYGNPPKCICGNDRKFNTFEKGYRIGCNLGNKCLEVAQNRTEKLKATLLEKYGVENSSRLQSSKEKTRQTNLKKYGTIHHSQNSIIKEKTIKTRKSRSIEQVQIQKDKTLETNLEKYGVSHHMQLKCQQEKVKNTNKEKYGSEFPLQNKESVEKMRKTYKQNNDISDVNKKTKNTLLEKYGVDAASRIKVSKSTLDILLNEDNFREFVLGKTREQVIEELKIHEHTLYLYAKKYNASDMFIRPLISNFEKEVAMYLSELNIIYRQNDRSIIGPSEIDFYIPNNNLAIECCGLYWHSENSAGRGRNYHYNKFTKCKELNITLLTIFQDEWDAQREKVKNRIKIHLDLPLERIYARNTVVKEIDTCLAKTFIEKYHLQSYVQSSIKLGLFYKDDLCAVMTFGKSRYNKEYQYELVRFCSNKNIIGGIQKLLDYFVKKYSPTSIVSYSDNRYFTGNMYKSLNFIEKETNIGYYYTDYHNRFNRLQFQKHKLVESGHEKNKSEWEIMQEINYDRIWDCGQTTWVKIF